MKNGVILQLNHTIKCGNAFLIYLSKICFKIIPTYTQTYMHTYIHTYIQTYILTYVHTYIHTYIHTNIQTYIHTYIHIYKNTYIHTYIHTYVRTYIHVCACAHVCMCVRAWVCSWVQLVVWCHWCGMIRTMYDWLNKFYNFYMAAVVNIISRCGLSIDAHHTNQRNKSKLALYKLLMHIYSHLNSC